MKEEQRNIIAERLLLLEVGARVLMPQGCTYYEVHRVGHELGMRLRVETMNSGRVEAWRRA